LLSVLAGTAGSRNTATITATNRTKTAARTPAARLNTQTAVTDNPSPVAPKKVAAQVSIPKRRELGLPSGKASERPRVSSVADGF
jgi:hypothetical protein